MSQFYVRFISKIEKIKDLAEALEKENLIDYIQLKEKYGKNKKKISITELSSMEQITYINLGWFIYSHVYAGERITTISLVGVEKGISKHLLRLIELAGEKLDSSKYEVVFEEHGPDPIYEGTWDFKKFKKEVMPKIEYDKK